MLLVLRGSKFIQQHRKQKELAAFEEENKKRATCENFQKKLEIIMKYDVLPIISDLPSVIFRVSVFWLALTYGSEAYANEYGDGPGPLLFILPLVLLSLVIGVNAVVGYFCLELKWEEMVVNAFGNILLPIYIDVFFLVSETI